MKAIIKKYLKIYIRFWKVAGKLTAMYRMDTVMLFVGVLLAIVLNTIYFNAIYNTTNSIGGWDIYEIFILLGIFQTNWGFFKMLYGKAMENALDKIFNGEYDFLLLKPINERFIAFSLPPMFKGIPSQAIGLLFIYYGASNLNLTIGILEILIFTFYILISQIVLFSMFQFVVSIAFMSGKSDELYSILEHAWQYSRYPGNVFSGKVFVFLTYIIPITLFSSYPTSLLLNKTPLTLYNIVYPIFICVFIAYLSNSFYKYGVKRYTSASS